MNPFLSQSIAQPARLGIKIVVTRKASVKAKWMNKRKDELRPVHEHTANVLNGSLVILDVLEGERTDRCIKVSCERKWLSHIRTDVRAG